MSLLVIDTSAVLAALAGGHAAKRVKDRIASAGSLHSPHLLDVEILHALRGLVLGGKISADRAADVRTDFHDLNITRYPLGALSDRVWQLRDNLTAYDACFVALAESLNCELVTCDERLARAPGHTARVDVYPAH
jgi:predicted nucleic acid-binding protein